MAELEVCQASGNLARNRDSLKIFRSGTLIISYDSINISFEILSSPGALFLFRALTASSSLDKEMIALSSSWESLSSHAVSWDLSGSVFVYSADESTSSVSFGLSVYVPSGLRKELRLVFYFPGVPCKFLRYLFVFEVLCRKFASERWIPL